MSLHEIAARTPADLLKSMTRNSDPMECEARDAEGRTILHSLLKNAVPELPERARTAVSLLKRCPTLASARDYQGRTALHDLCDVNIAPGDFAKINGLVAAFKVADPSCFERKSISGRIPGETLPDDSAFRRWIYDQRRA